MVAPRLKTIQRVALDLTSDFDTFENYAGVEDSNEAFEALQSHVKTGYLVNFKTLEEVERRLRCKPTLRLDACSNRRQTWSLALQLRTHESFWIASVAICSNVSRVASGSHKPVLPRVSDAIQAALAAASV